MLCSAHTIKHFKIFVKFANVVVGMMSLDTNIKIDKIIINFETIPYHCFRKHIPNEMPSKELLFDSANDAFKIELYQLKHEFDARLVSDLLMAAFELYSNLNYCILLVPTTMNHIPLLKHFTVIKKILQTPNVYKK